MFMKKSSPFLGEEGFRGKDTGHEGLEAGDLVFATLLKHGIALSLMLILPNLHSYEINIYLCS